jgi:hypothetical protein
MLLSAFCWLGMMWVHELGHVIGGIVSGGSVDRVVLAPWTFSRTDMSVDPHPLFTTWAGPVVGSLLPVALWATLRRDILARLFASFCLLANGAYLSFGALSPVADAAVLRRQGAPIASLLVPGGLGIAAALWLGVRLFTVRDSLHVSNISRRHLIIAGVLTLTMAVAGGSLFRDSL